MAERHPHAGETMVGPHDSTDDHGDTHGHDDHAHGGETLGPVDVSRWGAAILGFVLGLVIVVVLIQATS